jgi:hypothetical protein
MFKKLRAAILAASLASAVAVVVGGAAAPSASADVGPYYYVTQHQGPYVPWSTWVVSTNDGWLTKNQATISNWPMCVSAINLNGGAEAGSGTCGTATVTHPYSGTEERVAVVRPWVTNPYGYAFIEWAADWFVS